MHIGKYIQRTYHPFTPNNAVKDLDKKIWKKQDARNNQKALCIKCLLIIIYHIQLIIGYIKNSRYLTLRLRFLSAWEMMLTFC